MLAGKGEMNWKKCMPNRKYDSYVMSGIIFSEKYKNKIKLSSAVQQTGALRVMVYLCKTNVTVLSALMYIHAIIKHTVLTSTIVVILYMDGRCKGLTIHETWNNAQNQPSGNKLNAFNPILPNELLNLILRNGPFPKVGESG